MTDTRAMIRDELYDYDMVMLLINRKILEMDSMLGSAMSKKFAHMMDNDFMIAYQRMLDWRNIALRRDLPYGLILSLVYDAACEVVGHLDYAHSSMAVGEILVLLSSVGPTTVWPSVFHEINTLIKRNLSSRDIDFIIMFAFNNHIPLYNLKDNQILTKIQSIRVNHVNKLFAPPRFPFSGNSSRKTHYRYSYGRSLRDTMQDRDLEK
jgi:hypothetical protein